MQVSSLTGSYSNTGRKMEMMSSSSLSSIISLPLEHNKNLEKFSLHAAMIIAPRKSTMLSSTCITSSSLSSIISPPLQHNRNMDKFSPLHHAMMSAPRKFTLPVLQQSTNLELEKFSLLHPIMSSPRKYTLLSRCIKNNTAVVTSESWDEMVLESETPALVVFCCSYCIHCKMRNRKVTWDGLVYRSNAWVPFYGTWCVHTRVVHRAINELAEEYVGRVKFFVIDVDNHPEIAEKYGVSNTLPSVVLFKNGEICEVIRGASTAGFYVEAIDRVIAS